jgi:predicted metal-binding protein
MINRKELEASFVKHGFNDFKWVKPEKIIINQWVRMKCMFGCSSYGQKACCPPNSPSILECRNFIDEYREGAIFHMPRKVSNKEEFRNWSKEINRSLCNLERDIFLSGYYKVFVFFITPCSICEECKTERSDCNNQSMARPTPEAFGIDVFGTARLYNFPIEVLTDRGQIMNRYAFLMVE